MKNSNGKVIYVCFYIILDGSNEYFGIGHYGGDGGTFTRTKSKNVELNDVINIKSTISPDLTEAFICIIFSSGENNCFNYNIINQFNSFDVNYYDCSNNICQTNYNSLKVEYNPTKEEYIFGCLGNNLNITTCIFNEDYTYNELINKYESEYEIDSYSYIYNQDKDLYYLILSESSYIGKDTDIIINESSNIISYYTDLLSLNDSNNILNIHSMKKTSKNGDYFVVLDDGL
jgi:hypothetical protein